MTATSLASQIDQLCLDLEGVEGAESVQAIRRRLHSPLRVGVVGRVKAGKSTLLNALIGERLAPTDGGECTRLVSSYHFAPHYQVTLHNGDGSSTSPPFRKGEDSLEVDLPASTGLDARLEIGWPARRLSQATLIDTPGLGALDPSLRERERSMLHDVDGPARVDAVLYLMRHAHREDLDFLEAFREAGLPYSSPVNTLAVLSRVDEIAGGRLDAMESASRIAARYETDERISKLASSVVPVAGLLAETGATLLEGEFQELKQLAQLGPEIEPLLLSVDRFRDPDRNPLASETREQLLRRFGLFGIRFAVETFRSGPLQTSQALAEGLQQQSGVRALQELVRHRFSSRSQQLVARSSLVSLRAIAVQIRASNPTSAARVESAIEEIRSRSHELAELELAHQVAIREVLFEEGEKAELDRLSNSASPTAALGLDSEAGSEALRTAALAAIARWRERSERPLTDRQTRWGAEVMTRSYEGLYSRLMN